MSGAKLLDRLRRASILGGLPASGCQEHGEAKLAEDMTVPIKRRSSIMRARKSLLGPPLRLRKQKTAPLVRTVEDSNTSMLYKLFRQLPTELHILILCELSLRDILSLRLASSHLLQIVTQCQSSLVRHYISDVCTPLETFLYPPPAPGEATLHYILNWQHRKNTARQLSSHLCNFVAQEILRRNTAKKRRAFDPVWQRMHTRLQPLLFTLNHFFETYRRTLLERSAANRRAGQTFGIQTGSAALWADQAAIMDAYDPLLLLDLYHCYCFVLQALEQRLRPPSYAGPLERYVRGWTAPPASARQIEILLLLGGADAVAAVLAHNRYADRRAALDAFVAGLDPATNPSGWRRAWAALGVASDRFPLDAVPTTRVALPPLHLVWVPSALSLLLAKDVIEHVDFAGDSAVRSMSDFVSDMVGFDIVRFESPPAAAAAGFSATAQGGDGGDSSASESEDSDEES